MSEALVLDRTIGAVIVAFSPESARFGEVIAAAAAQTDFVVVVDNANGAGLDGLPFSDRLLLIDMRGNAGVAAAQNAGMRCAFARGASHVLLLDHDSIAAPDMVETLASASAELEARGVRVAAVGADYRDPRRPEVSPFVEIKHWRLRRHDRSGSPVTSVSYLISSGSLISAAAFDAIGPMEDRLFVDYVDIEWGLRASQMGWRCFGVFAAKLHHLLGDEPLRILGRDYPSRSPRRHYYMMRNAVWLLRRRSIPREWKFVEAIRLVRRSIAYALLAPQPAAHASCMWAGLRDAFRGRMGEWPALS